MSDQKRFLLIHDRALGFFRMETGANWWWRVVGRGKITTRLRWEAALPTPRRGSTDTQLVRRLSLLTDEKWRWGIVHEMKRYTTVILFDQTRIRGVSNYEPFCLQSTCIETKPNYYLGDHLWDRIATTSAIGQVYAFEEGKAYPSHHSRANWDGELEVLRQWKLDLKEGKRIRDSL